jgi:hypothetical protein
MLRIPRAIEITGAPRPTKIGNIVLPWRYDAAAHYALQLQIGDALRSNGATRSP